ncbi:hypothetical protein [Sphingomonas sp. Leaf205]|uniref:hypothetical protein n=1 Tax=Sphingomonas sp. Leaf205 TaxID=2876551 RepID=UPI001E5B9E4B|nr:hypothetical protein [Sphingomonas sp. Leaf205]
MSADLDLTQKKLEGHFAALAAGRTERGLPVFAFEHGLGTEELSEVSVSLKAALRTNPRLARHWLVWVVYATEQGYDYDGDEYWHTFERRMPLWDRGWRPALRGWFERFHKTYGGLVPVGRWANFFSIIAWPITHALLPKDLQGQLARALYGLRYNLVSRLDQSPADVGRYLARMARGGSSRFDNFLEQEELVGRIVLGLLDHRTADGDGAILPQALARIVGDLEKARNARQWLHDTRKAVESARMRGVARNAPEHIASALTNGGGQSERRPSIRPSLSLRRTAVEEWTLIVELPGLQQVADLSPELGDFLSRTRCSIAGASGLRPPGWLLDGAQRRALDAWPPTDQPVLQFQAPYLSLDHLLASEGHISKGPHWLFRVGSDGEAVEVIGRMVRPGRTYVLVSQLNLPDLSFAAPTSLRCRGAQAIQFEVPQALSAEQVKEITAAGLSVAQTIRVWPVGLSARGWDGEGTTEWLETECPCFAISHDHPVAEYEFRLGTGPGLRVAAKPAGVPTFIRLQLLPAGNHVLSVRVIRDPASGVTPHPVEGWISLSVRPPNPWVGGTIGHSGLIASSEPPEPTLDEFWEGLSQLDVLGPAGRQVSVCVELLDGTGSRIAIEQVANLTLPLGPDTWRTAFVGFERREKDPWGYLAASSGRILVDGEELGTVRIPLQRDASPVRWAWRSTSKSTQLRLINDHGGEAPVRVSFRSFADPLEEVPIKTEDAEAGFEPSTPGGLFTASYGEVLVPLVVGVRKVDGGLAGLLVEPDFTTVRRTRGDALAILRAIIAWSDTRQVGALASERRERVVSRLKECLYYVMCSAKWANAEVALRESAVKDAAVEAMLDCFDKKRVFAVVLARDAVKFARMPENVRLREFAALAHRYAVAPGITSKPALDLSDVLDRGVRLSEPELESMIGHLWDHPALTAGARLIQLLGAAGASVSSNAGAAA